MCSCGKLAVVLLSKRKETMSENTLSLYTIYNNPSGVTPMLRIGGYPLMSRSDVKARRKGLMLGMDLRFTTLEGLKTIVHPTFNLGYEAF